jgi:hypothetical protein
VAIGSKLPLQSIEKVSLLQTEEHSFGQELLQRFQHNRGLPGSSD